MILYAESSAILRWLLGAPGSDSIRAALGRAEVVFSSRLTVVEVERAIARRLSEGHMREAHAAEARRLFAAGLAQWRVVELTIPIAERAAQPFPNEPVRALDAIHLATVLFVSRVAAPSVLSTDERILRNARTLGLAVAG